MSTTEVYNYKIDSYHTEVRCYEMHCTIKNNNKKKTNVHRVFLIRRSEEEVLLV